MTNQNKIGEMGEEFAIASFKQRGFQAFSNPNKVDPLHDIFVEGLGGAQVKTQPPYYKQRAVSIKRGSFERYSTNKVPVIFITYALSGYASEKYDYINHKMLLVDLNKCIAFEEKSHNYDKYVIRLFVDGYKWAPGVIVLHDKINMVFSRKLTELSTSEYA